MAARGSLENLLEICEHPLIGPQVSEIALCGCRLNQRLLSPLRRILDTRIRKKSLHWLRKARHRLQMFMDFLEEELELESYDGIFQVLVNALRPIRGYGHSINLTVFIVPDDGSPTKILGHKEAVEQISENIDKEIDEMITRDAVRSSLNTLLRAAEKSGCCLERLTVNAWDRWWETASPMEKDKVYTNSYAGVLLNVKSFDLRADEELFADDYHELAAAVLSVTTHLETLHLQPRCTTSDWVDHDHKVEPFGRAIMSLHSDRLHEIEVEGAFCQQSDPISLLDKHSNTLRILQLSEVILSGSWEEVMIWIRDHCHLTRLSIPSPYEYDKDDHAAALVESTSYHGDLSDLDEFLEKKHKKKVELEEED